tara:strand:- start:594 stop:1811 length:1218 start_codon:yes stop_codon:yes gene_type:complete
MIQYLIWGISFIALYISFVWIIFLYLGERKEKSKLRIFPGITIVVPAYNEEKSIAKTIDSLLDLDYDKSKLKIIVVDDGSKDNTYNVAKNYDQVTVIKTNNMGKASALNKALSQTETEFFACVDADSFVSKEALQNMMPLFKNKTLASVISAIKVNKPRNIYEKLQKFEYIIAILSRKLMASIDTLAMTPGVLSVYRTDILRKVGMFDTENITEDFEIALRLKYHGYSLAIAEDAITYTNVPKNFFLLWRQRIRWYRGFIDNHIKYKDMFFSKKYGLMGYFQLPLNILGIVFTLFSIGFITYSALANGYETILRSVLIENYFFERFFDIPSFKEILLSQNIKILFPIILSLMAAFYLFYASHKEAKEPLRNPISIWAYFFLLPYLTCLHWFGAIYQHVMGHKKRW